MKIKVTGVNDGKNTFNRWVRFFCTRFTQRYKHEFQILSTSKDDLDIVDEQKVFDTFQRFKPDYVIHAAAIASTEFCDKYPGLAYDINVRGAVNVAKTAKAFGAKMIFISSEQVFNGNSRGSPFTEEDLPVPNTMYGKNKLEAEGLLKDILPELWILRFTWLFGVPEYKCGINPNILWDTIQLMMKGEKTKVTVNEYRGLTYVYEVIDQFTKIFGIPYGTYHVGSHNDLNRYEITCLILKGMGMENRIEELIEKDTHKYANQKRDVRLSVDKIKQYGIEFSETKDAIEKCISDFKLKF